MLPPADPTVLERNPRFKSLYENLCTQKLTSDGATRDGRKERAREEVEKKLVDIRTKTVRAQIICDALEAAVKTGSAGFDGLPAEMVEVVAIVSAQLQGRVETDDSLFLEDDVDYLLSNTAPVAYAISSHLSFNAEHLAAIANTTPSDLSEAASTLRAEVADQTREVNSLRLSVASLATQLQRVQLSLLETLVRTLEQVIHGAVARHSKAHAEHLALVASGLSSKTKLLVLSHNVDMDPALRDALSTYESALNERHAMLLTRETKLSENLRAYEKGGKAMRELARHYREILAETEEVKGEIARLQRS